MKISAAFQKLYTFIGVASGNGLATAVSFISTVVLARSFSNETFVLINTMLLLGGTISVAGGGIDSAATRLISANRSNEQYVHEICIGALRGRLFLTMLGVLVCLPFVYGISSRSSFSHLELILFFLFCAMSFSGLAYSLIYPVAVGAFRTAFIRQISVQLSFLLLFFASTALSAQWIIIYGPFVIIILVGSFAAKIFKRGGSIKIPPAFKSLAVKLSVGAIIYAAYERIDLYTLSYLWPEEASDYAVASRFAGGMILLSSAFTAISLPKASSAGSARELMGIFFGFKYHLVLIVLVSILAAFASWLMIPFIFGPEFIGAPRYASFIIMQFPIISLYMVFVFGLTQLGDHNWQIHISLILLFSKVIFVPLMYYDPIFAAISNPAAQVIASVFIAHKVKLLLNSPPGTYRQSSEPL